MKMLVTKLSNGKFRNEGELFAEVISHENVKLMGEMVALQALRNVMHFDYKAIEPLYNELIKDLHHMNEADYLVSDGYDFAQTAICFLLKFTGQLAVDACQKDKHGNMISIKCACVRKVDAAIRDFRKVVARYRQVDQNHNKETLADPNDYFEQEQTVCTKTDAMMDAMHLSDAEKETLECYMHGMTRIQIARLYGMSKSGIDYRRLRIRQKYLIYLSTTTISPSVFDA